MSFRRRMVALTAAAVAFAVAISAAVSYVAVSRNLHDRVDSQLHTLADQTAAILRVRRSRISVPDAPLVLSQQSLSTTGEIAFLLASGRLIRPDYADGPVTVTKHDLAVARGTAGAYYRDAEVDGEPVRVFVRSAGAGRAVIAVESLADTNRALSQLVPVLAAVVAGGVALAGALAAFIVGIGLAPVRALRDGAEHVATTGDLSRRIPTQHDDDIGRLAQSFNAMLSALEVSQRAQQQLVEDASHELRTPIASVRTNLEILVRSPDLAPATRQRLERDLVQQTVELGALVADLLDSARAGDGGETVTLRLDRLVTDAVDEYAVMHPEVRFVCDLAGESVRGRADRLRQAVMNLLDNAVKWSEPDAEILINLADGQLRVRDHGPGFQPSDLPFVFDRFYRSPAARSVSGSGLGLSIVQKVAAEHQGDVQARNAVGGGAEITFWLPTVERGD